MSGASNAHGSGSGHGGHDHARADAIRHRRPLAIAFGLTATFMVVEFVVGFATGSLALLSDAAHMGTDVVALAMALVAVTLAARPASPQRTYGFARLEALAAVANGLLLFGVATWVVVESIRRLTEPVEVPGLPLVVTASLGLVLNLVCALLLARGRGDSLNMRAAFLEVVADALGSVGVLVAAVVLLTTGWAYVDPIVGILIGVVILPRTWFLMRDAIRILLEAAPKHVDVAGLERDLEALPGVGGIHDLHVWTIATGRDAASGHVELAAGADAEQVLTAVRSALRERHGIDHATIQTEPSSYCGEGDGRC